MADTELRVVTVLFADLVSFSTAAEKTTAESTRAVLEAYFATCRTIVERYGGTIEKFIGDAVMAVWGYPVAGEDAAERAVRAGLDLIEAVAQPLRVGITTGTVAVSTDAAADGLIAGDTVNLAARIQQIAMPDEVWTDQATRDAAQTSIDFEPREAQNVKGREGIVALHAARAVMGERGGRGRLDVLTVPLVGYRRELSAIKDALQATIEGERGRLVVVTGEAGTGKSRLGRELLNYADGVESGIRWHSSRAAALDAATPFGALEAAVRGRLGVTEQNPDELVERLDAHLREFVPELARRAQIRLALGVLLGIGDKTVAQQDLFLAWIAWFASLASAEQDDTVVWVLDDAHFADDLLLSFVELLVTTVGTRVLVVLFARPELLVARPGLASVRGSSLIGLEGLNRSGMAELVGSLIDDVPDDIRDSVVAGAGGLPLYAIEVVRGMIDRGEIIVENGRRTLSNTATTLAIATPSLSGVVMSRLELLDPYDRRFLQQASVLGFSFTVEQVAVLVDMSTDAAAEGLARLAAKDLLRATNDTLSSEAGQHSFVQALVQQVAYETLAKEDRALLHLRAAELLSDSGADSGIVVEHILRARTLDDTAPTDLDVTEWLETAALRAERTSAYAIALRNNELAIETTTDVERTNALHLRAADLAIKLNDNALAIRHASSVESELIEHRLQAALLMSRAYHLQSRTREAREALEGWAELPAAEVSNELAALWAYTFSRLTYETDAAASSVWAERSLVHAELTQDPGLIHGALNLLANAMSARRLERVAGAIHLQAAQLARDSGLSYELSVSLNNVALRFANGANLASAVSTLAEAIAIGTQSGAIAALVYPIAARIEYLCLLGRIGEALEDAAAGEAMFGRATEHNVLELAELVQAIAFARTIAGVPVDPDLFERAMSTTASGGHDSRVSANALGTLADAIEHPDRARLARAGVDLEFETSGIGDAVPMMWPRGVDINLAESDFVGARSMFDYLPEVSNAPDTRMLAIQVRRLRASLEALDPASAMSRVEVEVALRTSIEELESVGFVTDRARTLAVLARLLESLGRSAGAASAREEAASILREIGALGLIHRLGLA